MTEVRSRLLDLVADAVRTAARTAFANLLWVLGVLAGGVVLGLAPAMAGVLAELVEPQEPRLMWRGFWSRWRTRFLRTQVLVGAPILVLGGAAWASWRALDAPDPLARGIAIGTLGVILVAGGVVAQVPGVADTMPDRSPVDIWRASVLVAALTPLTTVVIAVGAPALVAVQLFALPAALPFFAVGAPGLLVGRLAPRALENAVARLRERGRSG